MKKILCINCDHCNEGKIIDAVLPMFKCDIFDLFIEGVVSCPDFKKETRDKITKSQEENNGTK